MVSLWDEKNDRDKQHGRPGNKHIESPAPENKVFERQQYRLSSAFGKADVPRGELINKSTNPKDLCQSPLLTIGIIGETHNGPTSGPTKGDAV
jgi:hypothetical protein